MKWSIPLFNREMREFAREKRAFLLASKAHAPVRSPAGSGHRSGFFFLGKGLTRVVEFGTLKLDQDGRCKGV